MSDLRPLRAHSPLANRVTHPQKITHINASTQRTDSPLNINTDVNHENIRHYRTTQIDAIMTALDA